MRPSRPVIRLCSTVLLALLSLAGVASAQSSDGDPPDRVARLSYLAGDIGFLPSGAHDWSDASVNRPLTRGDRLAAGDDARAELELDRAALRLDRDTDIGVLQLDDRLAQFELTRGTLNLSVRALADGESYEIDTPDVALVVDAPGVFRVDVDARGGGTEITALDGQATVYGANGASRLLVGGHAYRFDDSSLARVDESYAGSRDAFDLWAADRDQRYADARSGRYVSDQVIGYQDLDDYGSWQDSADYGEVWYPDAVASDWAPYRFGHWAYVAPWGWTWIDEAPWGFAPYHYGRWVYVRDRWGWIPGPRGLRPVYAPALVAFVGGEGWNASVGSGPPIGWFPLGPGDFYDPWYRVSIGYYRRVNWHGERHDWHHDGDRRGDHDGDERYFNERWRRYHEGRDPELRYTNRNPPHGITAMSREAFAQQRPVRGHRLQLDPAHLRDATVLGGGSRLPPAHARTDRGGRTPPRGLDTGGFQRPVVMHRDPHGPGIERIHGMTGANSDVQTDARRGPWPPERRIGTPDPSLTPDGTMPSARFAHPASRNAPEFREGGASIHGTLPAVPRFVRSAPEPAPAAMPTSRRIEPAPERARPDTLPLPPRFEEAHRMAPRAVRENPEPTRVVQAPSRFESVRTPPPARFESSPRPTMPQAAPPVARRPEPPRNYAPPQPERRFTPPPQPAPAPHSSGQNRQAPAKARENPGAERFKHR